MKLPILLAFGLLFLVALTMGAVLGHDYLSWDDDVFLYRNPNLSPPTWESLATVWTGPYARLYVPIPYTVWWAVARVAGAPGPNGTWLVQPQVYHAVSLGVHLLNVLLAFGLLRRLVRNNWAAAAGALIFGVHPLQVESVAWASELKDLLSGTFSLTALWLYLVSLPADGTTAPRRWWLHYGLSTIAFAGALLCKPNTVALPVGAAVLALWLARAPWRRALGGLLLWLALAAVHVVLTRSVQSLDPSLDIPLWQRPFVAGDALAFYIGKAFWPVALSPDYGRAPGVVLASAWVWVIWLVPVAVLAAVWSLRRRWPWAMAGTGLFVAALLPALGLMPFDFQQYSTVADHYAYVAVFGLAIILAGILTVTRWRLGYALCGIVLALLAAQSNLQVLVWQNNFSFWTHTLHVNSRSWLAHNNLGAVYQMLGKPEQAIPHYQAGLRLKPEDADTLVNLGIALVSVGRGAEALAYLEKALSLRPGDLKAHFAVGALLVERRRYADALPHLEPLVYQEPENAPARFALAQALLGLGRREEALSHLRLLGEGVPPYPPAVDALRELTEGLGD